MRMESLEQQTSELRRRREAFAVATVIRVRGSASAHPGSKALINREGKNIFGWVGGGCAETFVCNQALEALQEHRPRIVTADLDDEIFGLGMPCGGLMDVYIEPQFPRSTLHVRGKSRVAGQVAWLGHRLGFRVAVEETSADAALFPEAEFCNEFLPKENGDLIWLENSVEKHSWPKFFGETEKAFVTFFMSLIQARGLPSITMQNYRGLSSGNAKTEPLPQNPHLVLVGHSRIIQELACFGRLFRWPVTVVSSSAVPKEYASGCDIVEDRAEIPLATDDLVIVASHHKEDPSWLRKSLAAQCPYVGLIASANRARLIFQSLEDEGVEDLFRIHAPAGMEMNCQNPTEIALSIVSEILLRQMGGKI